MRPLDKNDRLMLLWAAVGTLIIQAAVANEGCDSFLCPSVGTIILQMINFAVFLGLLTVVFIRPVSGAIEKRRQYINGLESDYDRHQAEAAALRNETEAIRVEALRQAESVVAKAREEASYETAAISAECHRQEKRIIEEARLTAEREYEHASASLPQVTQELAKVMLDQVLPAE